MAYSIKEIYYTLQGEGFHAGTPAVFCRFTGCNLWSGREEDRSTAKCTFCDTDFIGIDGPNGGKFSNPMSLALAARSLWPTPSPRSSPLIVCTGGEPLLQLDEQLVAALHEVGFTIAVETNGTCAPPAGLDWICVSPKQGVDIVLRQGSELKLVFPQSMAMPDKFEDLDFKHFFLQPMDGPMRESNTQLAVKYCLEHPQWRLSLQTHKFTGIP